MAKIVGLTRREYDNKAGKHVTGYNIYTTYERKGVMGVCTGKEWLTVDTYGQLAALVDGAPEKLIGLDVDFLFNRFGSVEKVQLAPPPSNGK